MSEQPDLDKPLYGAAAIGREAGLVDEADNVELRKAYHGLERGYIDASKYGRQWVSTRRRIRRTFTGTAT